MLAALAIANYRSLRDVVLPLAPRKRCSSAVRWPTVLRVGGWWLLTPVVCAALGLLGTLALLPLA